MPGAVRVHGGRAAGQLTVGGRKKNVGDEPTKPTAIVVGARGAGEEVLHPQRVFGCPGCGAEYVIEPTKEAAARKPPPTTLHFSFKCVGCGYKAAVGTA